MSQKKPPRRVPRTGWKLPPHCLTCEAENRFEERSVPCIQEIRGEEVHYQGGKWVCAECDAAFLSPEQATQGVKIAVETYQREHGLLTAEQIRDGRKSKKLSTKELAKGTKLGVATIKRLEAGTTVQQPSTNRLLHVFLSEGSKTSDYELTFCWHTEAAACPSGRSPWQKDAAWNTREPWSPSQMESFLEAADSNELALAV